MSGSTDPQVLAAQALLCMLATGNRQTSQHPVDNASYAFVGRTPEYERPPTPFQSPTPVIQTPAPAPAPAPAPVIQAATPPVPSSALVQRTSPTEQSSPAEADTNPEEVYTIRSLLLQALLTVPSGDWMRLRDMYEYLYNKHPGLRFVNGQYRSVVSHFNMTLKRMMGNMGIVEKWAKPGGRHHWRIKAGERQRAISIAWEEVPPSLRRGRPYSLMQGSWRARNVQDQSRMASPEPASSGSASRAPALSLQPEEEAPAAPWDL